MATPAHDKYYLRTLHQEIDLFDRKLAHLLKYDTFASEAERTVSAGKLSAKRELLARTARQLVSEGIEFNPADLPRSFRTEPVVEATVEDLPSAEEAQPSERVAPPVKQFPSPFAGTVLDGQAQVEEYKRQRAKSAQG